MFVGVVIKIVISVLFWVVKCGRDKRKEIYKLNFGGISIFCIRIELIVINGQHAKTYAETYRTNNKDN